MRFQKSSALLPVGEMNKQQVREVAERLGIRTAQKPDSQDVCFITKSQGRRRFLEPHMEATPGQVVTKDGTEVGSVPGVEFVTIGQRRWLGLEGGGEPMFAIDVGIAEAKAVSYTHLTLPTNREV